MASAPETLSMIDTDVTLEISHLRALLNAGYYQLEGRTPSQQQIESAGWMLRDALLELENIENQLYPQDTV